MASAMEVDGTAYGRRASAREHPKLLGVGLANQMANAWSMLVSGRSDAETFKNDGNAAYKAGDYVRATELYTKAIGAATCLSRGVTT